MTKNQSATHLWRTTLLQADSRHKTKKGKSAITIAKDTDFKVRIYHQDVNTIVFIQQECHDFVIVFNGYDSAEA